MCSVKGCSSQSGYPSILTLNLSPRYSLAEHSSLCFLHILIATGSYRLRFSPAVSIFLFDCRSVNSVSGDGCLIFFRWWAQLKLP